MNAKTANTDVPYLFWFALSMVFYLRVLDGLRTRDFAIFAALAALSVCTKDQAYGLYLLMPLPIVMQLWRARRLFSFSKVNATTKRNSSISRPSARSMA